MLRAAQWNQIWYGNSAWYRAFLPVAFWFGALVRLRRALYRIGWLKTTKLQIPVLIVGNITVGGTGKTPLVIALTQALLTAGFSPGVVSRGYRGDHRVPTLVHCDSSPDQIGDEALLIARRSGCPVVVGRDRVAAAQELFQTYNCDCIVSDDGLQHYRLCRDIEIAVVDAQRGLGNSQLLPAGPLREPPARLKEVDYVLYHGATAGAANEFSLQGETLISMLDSRSRPITEFAGKSVYAVAGIGNPQRFFKLLQEFGLEIHSQVFPDHHRFSARDFSLMRDKAILMTEKDAIKCTNFGLSNAWYLPVTATLTPQFVRQIIERLRCLRG